MAAAVTASHGASYAPFTTPNTLNEEKVTQAAAYFLSQTRSGTCAYIKVLKLLYFFEREMMRQTGYPVLGDEFFIMKQGAILSNTMDLMTEEPQPGERSIWHDHIATEGYNLKIVSLPEFDLISEIEKAILDDLWIKYGSMNKWAVVEEAHKLPEHVDISRGRIPLPLSKIFRHFGFNQARAVEHEKEILANRL
jgi:uncharacterized phage-associated protein